jgi:hypothetical protein
MGFACLETSSECQGKVVAEGIVNRSEGGDARN